jgi:hypothetical protein
MSSAQKLERTKNWEVGDKLTWNYVLNNKAQRMVEEVVEVTDADTRITYKVGDTTYDAALSNKDMTYPKGMCMSNGQPASSRLRIRSSPSRWRRARSGGAR